MELTDVPFASLPDTPESTVLASTRTTTVDGRAARVTESTYSAGSRFDGQRLYQWSIDWGSAGTLTVFTIEGSATSYDVNKTAADRIASSARFVP